MDAVEFFKEAKRLCNHTDKCADCVLKRKDAPTCMVSRFPNKIENAEEMISIVEDWSKKHPVKTRQSEFLKMFPNAEIKKGVVNIYPCSIDTVEVQGSGEYCQFINGGCDKCREAYWLAVVE